jgi:hypothetical protein
VLLVGFVAEVLGFILQIVLEFFGGLVWAIFEGILSKSDAVVGCFVLGLLIAVILFCVMSDPFQAAIWSTVELVVLLVLGFAAGGSAR